MLYGGRVLGEGGQGCILYPSVTSSNESEKYNYVTKVMSKSGARDEYAIANMLAKIDAKGLYGIYTKGSLQCDIGTSILKNEGVTLNNDSSKCSEILRDMTNNSKQFCALTVPKYIHDATHVPKHASKIDILRGLIYL